MENGNDTRLITELLKSKNVPLSNGLSDFEVEKIQEKFGFRFPPDLRDLLQNALPLGENFYDWRESLNSDVITGQIQEMLDWPLEGIEFEIEHNAFWVEKEVPGIAWGQKPTSLPECRRIAAEQLARYSKLIPIFSHRYIPETPHESGNPVFSVYQSDIIYYGSGLLNYFRNEFLHKNKLEQEIKRIPFWSDICEGKIPVVM